MNDCIFRLIFNLRYNNIMNKLKEKNWKIIEVLPTST
jgi:hypothetical protein